MTPAWRAFANMSRAAARDPLWALACVVFSPIRGGIYLAKSLLMALIVALVLLFAVSFPVEAAGQKGAWPHRVGNIAAGLVALAVFWRFASRPLIDLSAIWRATPTARLASPPGKRSGPSRKRKPASSSAATPKAAPCSAMTVPLT